MNNPPTVEDFRNSLIGGSFPEDPYTDEIVQQYLDLAAEIHVCSANAQIYLAAHFMYLDSQMGTNTGDVEETEGSGFAVEQSVGDLKVKYLASQSDKGMEDAEYMRTPYGRRYINLRDAALKKFTPRVFR